MAICEVYGNDYDKPFEVNSGRPDTRLRRAAQARRKS
jgi:hypothetical protein